MLYGGIALIAGIVLGVFSLAREKAFLIIIFLGLPILAYGSKFFGNVGPEISMNNNASIMENFKDMFMEIPEDYRLAVIVILPAIIIGRIIVTIYRSNQDVKFMDPVELSKKKKKILKSYGV